MPVSHSVPSREAAALAAAASAAALVAAALRAAGSLSTRLPDGGTCSMECGRQQQWRGGKDPAAGCRRRARKPPATGRGCK